MIRQRDVGDERVVDVQSLVELYADAVQGVFVHMNRNTGRIFITTIEAHYEADEADLERVSEQFGLPLLFAD